MQSTIWFLKVKNVRPAEIHRLTVEVYGECAVNAGNMSKWCQLFKRFRTNKDGEEQSKCQSLVTDDWTEKMNANILQNRQFTISHNMPSALIYMLTTRRSSSV